MAYCPKCGVELKNYVKNCPLCKFPIPDINDPDCFFEEDEKKYPKAINIYKRDNRIIKNKVFFSFLVVVLSAVIILGILKLIYPVSALFADYAIIVFIAMLLYMFFLFGYLKTIFNLLGLTLNTLFMTFAIDYQNKVLEWFPNYALPIILILFGDISLFIFLYKISRNRNQFVYVPTVILLLISLLSIGVDSVVTINMYGGIRLSWSLIVLITGCAISVILLGVYHGVPEKTRAWLKRKLHV